MMDAKEESARNKMVQCLQLLLLLIPEPNYKLLKDLMALLKRVTDRQEDNRMSAGNLGTLFAPLILCPRKLSAEAMQSNHQMLTAAVTFMIEEADALFDLPGQLRRDIETYMEGRKAARADTPKKMPTLDEAGRPQSPVVNTIFSFVDRADDVPVGQGSFISVLKFHSGTLPLLAFWLISNLATLHYAPRRLFFMKEN